MQEMTHRHTREWMCFYNEHRDACTNCGRKFQNGMCAHLGYDTEEILLSYVMIAHICYQNRSSLSLTEPEYEKVAPESKLWRYMDLSKFLSMIGKKGTIFCICGIIRGYI